MTYFSSGAQTDCHFLATTSLTAWANIVSITTVFNDDYNCDSHTTMTLCLTFRVIYSSTTSDILTMKTSNQFESHQMSVEGETWNIWG